MRTAAKAFPIAGVVLATLWSIGCPANKPADLLKGKWKDDGGYVWEFTPDGRVISEGLTPVTYKVVDSDTLTWTFEETKGKGPAGALILTQSYSIAGDTLTIVAESSTGGVLTAEDRKPLVLTRIKEGTP
jgi:hypothetical protein